MVENASSEIDKIAERYLVGVARVDPYGAVRDGLSVDESHYTDYSTAGVESRLEFARQTNQLVAGARPETRAQRITAVWLTELTGGEIALWENDLHTPVLRLLDGPIVDVISMFRRVLSRAPVDWREAQQRMSDAPSAIASLQSNLVDGLARGRVTTRRQAEMFAEYCEDCSGQGGRGVLDWLVAAADVPAGEQDSVTRLVGETQEALADLAVFMHRDYLPATSPTELIDGAGYRARLRYYAGGDLDPVELYERALGQTRATVMRLRSLAHEITGNEDVSEAIWALEADPAESLRGDRELCLWLTEQIDEIHDYVAGGILPAVDGHVGFDVRLARGESRSVLQSSDSMAGEPNVIWIKETGELAIPKWRYLSLCHAVVVPGSWYQRNRWLSSTSPLTRAQQLIFDRTAYTGWGHYSTLLLDELGYYSSWSAQISFLQRELLQSVRVLVDVGYNLGLSVPEDSDICGGCPWSEAIGTQFIAQTTFMSRQAAAGEMRRVISCAGQFPSYRVLSDTIMHGRSHAELESDDQLRRFHAEVLDLGPLGAKDLAAELKRLPASPGGAGRASGEVSVE